MRRRMLMQQNKSTVGNLPAEYTRLEYVEASGHLTKGAFAITDVSITNNTGVRIRFSSTSGKGSATGKSLYVLGSLALSKSRFNPVYITPQNKFMYTTTSASTVGEYAEGDTDIHEVEYNINNREIKWDGTLKGYAGDISKENTVCINYLFARNYNGADGRFNGRIYYCDFYENGELYRRYMPALRNSDNKIGFYEVITNTFITSSGEEEFTGE